MIEELHIMKVSNLQCSPTFSYLGNAWEFQITVKHILRQLWWNSFYKQQICAEGHESLPGRVFIKIFNTNT